MIKLIKKIYRGITPAYIKVRVSAFLHDQVVYNEYNNQLKCIFVHVPKTAGTSLQETLFDFSHTGHFRWDEYRAMDRKKFSEYYKFAFVRNPWDRVVSAYFYLSKGGRNSSDKKWADEVLSEYDDFNTFVLEWLTPQNIYTWNHFVPQTDFIFDKQDQMKVDFCGKFESLNEDFLTVSKRLGADKNLKNINKSSRGSYSQYYTEQTKAIVAEVYERDIRLLGYTFDD